jgi:hypothetical protein
MLSVLNNTLIFKLTPKNKNPERITISIADQLQNVGIMFSGGIESTLMLGLLTYYNQHIRNFNICTYTVENNESRYDFFVDNILNLPPFQHIRSIKGVPNSRKDGIIREGIKNVILRDDVDILFTGVNKIPNVDLGPGAPIRITAEELKQIPKINCPVLHLSKDYTIWALKYLSENYFKYDLYSETFSCTEARQPCMNCWFCRERNWGDLNCGY